MRKIVLILTLLSYFSSSAQTDITINFLFDSNVVKASFRESKSHLFYVGIENDFTIAIPGVESRYITLSLDTSNLDFKTFWRPMMKIDGYGFEMTLNTTKDLGAYNPNGITNSEKYIDNDNIHWEKQYSIKPLSAQEIVITIYKYTNDSTGILYNVVKFYSNHIPKPSFNISNLDSLKINEILTPSLDTDFVKGKDWYGIKRFTLSTYDKKNKLIFTQTCFGNFITPEMFNAINDKKRKSVKLTKIESIKYKYKDIHL
jgi:hypothetical protein